MARIHDTDFARFDRRCHLLGWGLFILSAVFYCVASARAGDMVALGGSLLFLIACFAFLAPFYRFRDRVPADEAAEGG